MAQNDISPPPAPALLVSSRTELARLLGLSRSALWRVMREPGFPKPRELPGKARPAWEIEAVREWFRNLPEVPVLP